MPDQKHGATERGEVRHPLMLLLPAERSRFAGAHCGRCRWRVAAGLEYQRGHQG